MDTYIELLTCTECGIGHYFHAAGRGPFYECTNPACDHEVATCDFDLDPDESLTYTYDGLAIVVTD